MSHRDSARIDDSGRDSVNATAITAITDNDKTDLTATTTITTTTASGANVPITTSDTTNIIIML